MMKLNRSNRLVLALTALCGTIGLGTLAVTPANSMPPEKSTMTEAMPSDSTTEIPSENDAAPTTETITPADTTAPSETPETPATEDSVSDENTTPEAETSASEQNLLQLVDSNESFKTLAAAVKAAGLEATLSGTEPLTVFAPTDEAFAALPPGTLENLLKPENKDILVKILTYHVVPGTVTSQDIKTGEVKTVEGSSVSVSVEEDGVTVNNAKVVQTDVQATNGVVHAIDKVILPPDLLSSSTTEK